MFNYFIIFFKKLYILTLKNNQTIFMKDVKTNVNKNFLSKTDPQGSYIGNDLDLEKPVQDADDL